MPLLVDCYNVLYADMPTRLAGLDEAGLCRVLASSVWGGQGVVVVCDGHVKPNGPEASPVVGVDLIYSGPGRSADDVIIEMIDRDSAPRRITVVSNDRAIQKAAKRRRCRVMSSETLIAVLSAGGPRRHQTTGTTNKEYLSGPLTEDEVEHWLEQFGVDGDDQENQRDKPLWENMDIDDM